MSELSPDELKRYKYLSAESANARDNMRPPLTKDENAELNNLYLRQKPKYGGRRLSKKRPTARRLRSSKARKSRKARTTRRR